MSVLSYLQSLASDLNIADLEAGSITRSIDTIHTRLGNYFGTDVKERFRFGSSTRKTMLPRTADANSDVDYMVVFDNSSLYKPQTYIARLKRFAERYYSQSEISQSTPTVVLELGHIKFDLVPAYRSWGSIYIPAPRSAFTDWTTTDPLSFNTTIEQANINNKFMLKPMIRLLKYWNAKNGYLYESYGLEQKIARMSFYSSTNLRDYLFAAIDNLTTWDLPEYKSQKLARAKQLVNNVRQYERDDMPFTAETEIKKLLPQLPGK